MFPFWGNSGIACKAFAIICVFSRFEQFPASVRHLQDLYSKSFVFLLRSRFAKWECCGQLFEHIANKFFVAICEFCPQHSDINFGKLLLIEKLEGLSTNL